MRYLPISLTLVLGLALGSIAVADALSGTAHAQEVLNTIKVDARAGVTGPVGGDVIQGSVIASQSRWIAGRIATESIVRTDDGREISVRQPGGTIDGIGMRQFPGQPVLAFGDRTELELWPSDRQSGQKAGATVTAIRDVSRVVSLDRSYGGNVLPKSGVPGRMDFVRTTNDNGAELYWESGCIFLSFDSEGTTHLPASDEIALLQQVFQTWRSAVASCSYLEFSFDGIEATSGGFDGKNVVKFLEDFWGRPATEDSAEQRYSPEAAALTTLFFVNDPESPRNGEILDGDIEMNAVNFRVSAEGNSDAPGNGCLSDLANTLTHEAGHLMGLDHTCRAPAEPARLDHTGSPVPSCIPLDQLSSEITEATMFNFQECGETKKITPADDDIAAICAIYGNAEDPGTCERARLTSDNGACSASGSGGPSGLTFLLVALCAGLLLLRRRESSHVLARSRRRDRLARRR